MTTRSEET